MVAGGHVTRNQPPYDAEEGFERKTLLFNLMANGGPCLGCYRNQNGLEQSDHAIYPLQLFRASWAGQQVLFNAISLCFNKQSERIFFQCVRAEMRTGWTN